MLIFKDGFKIYPYGKEILIWIGVGILVVGGIFFGYRSYHNLRMERDQAQFNLKELGVKNEDLQNKLHQAQNNPPVSEEALKQSLSKEFQDLLEKHKQEVMMVVKQEIAMSGKGNGTGTYDDATKVYSYPEIGKKDPIMSYIHVDAKDPKKPAFEYELAPQTFTLEGSLNFDKKEGVSRYWVRPVVKGLPKGMNLSVTEAEFSPSDSFNAYLTSLSTGHTEQVPVPAKWTGSFMVGKEFAKEFIGGQRTVYGVDLMRNWNNGLGVGGGVLGSTVFVKAGFSWGK